MTTTDTVTYINFNNINRQILVDCGNVTFCIFFRAYSIYTNKYKNLENDEIKINAAILIQRYWRKILANRQSQNSKHLPEMKFENGEYNYDNDTNTMKNEECINKICDIQEYNDISECNEFFDIMKYEYIKFTKNISNQHKTPYEHIFFVKDSPSEQNWRKKIYDKYKNNRNCTKYKKKSFNLANLFKRVYGEIFPNIVNELGVNVIQIDNAEADDTISVITKILPPRIKVIIISSDTDYLQLLARNNTYIYTIKNTLVNEKLDNKSSHEKLLEKILNGDKTDNIPPCIPNTDLINFYLKNLDYLHDVINTNEYLSERYITNRTLIDFEYIPDKIKNNIIDKYKECVEKCTV